MDPSNGFVPSPSSSSSSSTSPSPLRLRSKGRRGRSSSSTGVDVQPDKNPASPPGESKAGGGGGGGASTRSGAAAAAVKTAAIPGASATAAATDRSDAPAAAKLGERARVLYDDTDWYMSTVVAVHRGGTVTVRFDDGSEERVTLSPGDVETCPDDALAPAAGHSGPPTPNAFRSRGGGSNRSSPRKSSGRGTGRAAVQAVRTLGPGGRVLKEGEGKVLTEERARALLDTAPERLVGLVYQENHVGYGGWWETTVTRTSEKRVGDAGGDGNEKNQDAAVRKRWPESVTVGQMDRSAREEGDSASGKEDEDDGPDFVYTRKMSVFLSRLRAWDKHREAEWEATLEEEGAAGGGGGSVGGGAVAEAKVSSDAAAAAARSVAAVGSVRLAFIIDWRGGCSSPVVLLRVSKRRSFREQVLRLLREAGRDS